MAQEQEKEPAQLSHIGIDLTEGIVSLFGARTDGLVRFRFYLPQVFQQLLTSQPLTERSVARLVDSGEVNPDEPARPATAAPAQPAISRERSPTVVLPGKLQSTPIEGRPDRQAKPTAWAQFLAHIDSRDGATLLSTSFHGRTRDLALGLRQGDPITAQGYLHLRAANDPEGRLSTFSVIHLIAYPGKPLREPAS